ncbi:cytoskeleton-associated protein 2-like [Varanus komodoensis]|uniref:cytoskeleton-associated protein 2-like n=1 Tax=Varanus komodoensis TaxID=61221 RepID=UPI001CF7AE20|nr:cytoskeleton-associated protein 2-like [Varanus komodoensis]
MFIRHLLEQWLASRGKRYKRPPMTLPAQRLPKEKENQKLSWNCPEEKQGEEREQLSLAAKTTSILTECQKLAEEGFSSEALLAKLSCIPEVEKFAQFWICKAQLLAQRGAFDAVGLYEAAVGAGAAPLQDLRTIIAGILKDTSKAILATPGSKKSPRQATQGRAHKPCSTVKLQVVPLLRAKDPSVRPDTKLVTPVRRSLRIEGALACYPPMLQDHDPVVSSLSDVLDSGGQFVFRSNTALPEEVDLAGLVAELQSLREEATQHPKYAAVPHRAAAQSSEPSPLQTLSP